MLYLIEPIDEVAIQNLQTYKEKKFVDISKEDLELGSFIYVFKYFLLCELNDIFVLLFLLLLYTPF